MSYQTVGGRYTLDGRLGEGGMGQVFRARHLQLGKPFALKLISPAFALDSIARERFNQEAKLASEITHPNIVGVVDYGEDPQFGAYMVMELVEGEPLLPADGAPMTVRRVCDVLGQVADALEHIHKRGIVHGDVKADNIMLAEEASGGARRRRVARLLDFGLARRQGGALKEEHISGSPHYLAPERCAGATPTVAADVYALGVLGYLMLTGTLPFDGNVPEVLMAHIYEEPPPIAARRNEAIDQALDALVMRAMAKDPMVRHQSAGQFKYELNTVMDMMDLRRRSSTQLRTSQVMEAVQPVMASREGVIAMAFDRSRIPQALCTQGGEIAIANKAFVALVGERDAGTVDGKSIWHTSLVNALPGLEHAFAMAQSTGKVQERQARVERPGRTPLELTAWIAPLPMPGQEIHLEIRVEELGDAHAR